LGGRTDSFDASSRHHSPSQFGFWRDLNMPRYLIEREFPDGLAIPMNDAGVEVCRSVIDNNAQDLVTWVHSYVTPDRKQTFCIYDGPGPEAVRSAASRNRLPITKITEVRVLNPYFYT
jgi:hypothetical protein